MIGGDKSQKSESELVGLCNSIYLLSVVLQKTGVKNGEGTNHTCNMVVFLEEERSTKQKQKRDNISDQFSLKS